MEEKPELIAEIEEKIRTKLLVEGVTPKKKGGSKKSSADADQETTDLPEEEAMPETDE